MKQLKKYLRKAFAIHNVISRFFQFGIAFFVMIVTLILCERFETAVFTKGFYSGALFVFMLERLDRVFRK